MLTFLLGPIFAIFPAPWRESLPFAKDVRWEPATAVSGLAEAACALIALMYWYAHAMSTWVGNGVGVALTGKMGPEVRLQDIGGAALFVWWMHPVTWLLVYFGLEGVVRLCTGAFGGHACGTLPFVLVDKIAVSPFRRRGSAAADGAGTRGNLASIAGAVRERARTSRLAEVPDELSFTNDGSGEILEISTYQRKQDWTPPRVVCYSEGYYRLEAESTVGGARPYRYRLRRLAAGVPGRTVLLYAPRDTVIRDAVSR